jgi:DeoR/GlpR family transcriptional regulator of sugar metabolism
MSSQPVADIDSSNGSRQGRQAARQRAITEAVMSAGAVRIEELAERFGISQMTVHRDLDELEGRGLLRKSRGVATALSTALVESSDVYRSNRELPEKEAIAHAALEFIEPGQAIMLDDSTTTLHLVPHLHAKKPLTVITNTLTIMNELKSANGITLLGLGGQYYNWCSAYMGRMTTTAISALRADLLVMSTSAISDDIAFHQTLETVDVKRAMFDAASTRILLADHTKFDKRALHAMLPLAEFDAVIVDYATDRRHVKRLRDAGVHVVVAKRAGQGR